MYSKTVLVLVSTFLFLSMHNCINATETISDSRPAVYDTILKDNIIINKEDASMKIDSKIDTKTSDLVKIIVEFNPIEDSKNTKDSIKAQHDGFKEFINDLNKNKANDSDKITIEHEYNLVLNGMSLTIPGNRVPELLESPLIKKIWNDNVIQLDPPITIPMENKLKM